MKNITMSANEELIVKGRRRAHKEGTTLNEAFREWLQTYVGQETGITSYKHLVNELAYANPGKQFSRDELNER